MRITFDVVQVTAKRTWMEDGKKRQKTKKFEQTINPFNTNAAGIPKTRQEILVELNAERDKWMTKPIEQVKKGY
jgi:hypothetical protein